MYVKFCEYCGDKFITKSETKKYCSKRCVKEAAKQRQQGREQLCWRCKKACGGCSWSSSFKEVDGWDAEATIVKDEKGAFSSYKIYKCPEFVEGRIR